MVMDKTAAGCLDKLAKQTGLHRTAHIKVTATAHRLETHNSFLSAAKPSKWIVLLQLSHPIFIIISVILNDAHLTMH